MDKEIFKQITRAEERIKLFADLAKSQVEILCKGKADTLCKVRGNSWNEKSLSLECNIEGSAQLQNQEEFLGYFFIGGEKYYFESRITIVQNKYHIPLPAELFHLQRRQNYRVRIPENYTASFNIISVNEATLKITGALGDLSSQGCRVLYKMNAPLMKMGDEVLGQLVIGKRSPIEIKGVVRHIKVDDSNKVAQTFGIEFVGISPILENNLFALTMEIHKEVFKRPL